ncbi:hypothetical protein P152DRAFT_403829 [Eremomyces bilateralis CBS 781.70]|uniref:Chitin biosynthesis protein n=1 Tax=Eremomyces bilateralis CBS 781.70 TaxID=1392243 RepID=A0A6G1FTW8_9PEZI|nr:uncharacterized protein P152DRAFT_403829 [Eremomyces bilateralis CBS 781.70]KAF1809156.1 hypothetical protein P152DRAFT_403829 [Eremomyces bilateralis CBS 781.70]
MLFSLTVGKVDAGVAVLLTEDKRLIEFPSILLPPDISSGSIVDIQVSRNLSSEKAAANAFQALQNHIYETFGNATPKAPVLRCRNATQTSVVLEWDPIDLATAELRSLSLYRNGSKAGNIPRPFEMQSTKISGLAVDTEYTFHLQLRTSAGVYNSEKLTVRTHKMTDVSGITITPGIIPSQLKESLAETVERIGAKLIDSVRIDTTHFVCTEGRGQAWEKAVEMNIPVVVPDWIKGCEREGRIVGVRGYYLNADPRLRNVGPSVSQQQVAQQPHSPSPQRPMESPRTEVTPPTPERATHDAENNINGGRDDESEGAPPTPPPKSPAKVPSDSNQSSEESVQDKDTEPDDEEEEDEDEDGDAKQSQKGKDQTDANSESKSPERKLPQRSKSDLSPSREIDTFDEVSL